MTVQQMLYFIEVARVKNFTKAAENLYVTQSAISHAVQSLENELGVPLFTRGKNTKKVDLTKFGIAFLPYCEEAIEVINGGKSTIEKMRNPMSGEVSVMYSFLNCHTMIPLLFSSFNEDLKEKNITINFSAMHGSEKFERELISGNADLAFSCTSNYEGLKTHEIAKQRLFVYSNYDNPIAEEDVINLKKLSDQKIIGFAAGSNIDRWINTMFQNVGISPNIVKRCHDGSIHMTDVALGRGISIAPDMAIDGDIIKKIRLDNEGVERGIYMLWSANRELSESAEFVRELCIEWSEINKQFYSL